MSIHIPSCSIEQNNLDFASRLYLLLMVTCATKVHMPRRPLITFSNKCLYTLHKLISTVTVGDRSIQPSPPIFLLTPELILLETCMSETSKVRWLDSLGFWGCQVYQTISHMSVITRQQSCTASVQQSFNTYDQKLTVEEFLYVL